MNKIQNSKYTHRFFSPAETLLEVVLSLSIIVLMITIAGGVYMSSTRTRVINRNDLIAAGLVEDGAELMRNIRDTNLLRFSAKPKSEGCWKIQPSENCEAVNTIADGFYKIGVVFDPAEPSKSLFFEEAGNDFETANDTQSPAQEYRLYLNDRNIYEYCVSESCTWEKTPFYHGVELSYPPEGGGKVMQVVSRVSYRIGSNMRTLTRLVFLTSRQ